MPAGVSFIKSYESVGEGYIGVSADMILSTQHQEGTQHQEEGMCMVEPVSVSCLH
jgi:hypothetical protein